MSRSEAAEEQDRAAGGRDRRMIKLADGRTPTAYVALFSGAGSRRVYAKMRYWLEGRTIENYVGEAPGATREERLRTAWRLAERKGLLRPRR